MVSYYRKRKRKKDRRRRDRRKSGPHGDTTVTIGEATTDFMKWLEEGMADGSIVAMGTFGDAPDFSDIG